MAESPSLLCGSCLSNGDRQSIDISQALYHNPEVLVFDEAISAVDTVTEQAVMDAIDALAHSKIILHIEHRHSKAKDFD